MLMDYNQHLFDLEHHSFMANKFINVKLSNISFTLIMRIHEDLDVGKSGCL